MTVITCPSVAGKRSPCKGLISSRRRYEMASRLSLCQGIPESAQRTSLFISVLLLPKKHIYSVERWEYGSHLGSETAQRHGCSEIPGRAVI
uniref:Uncharacterized protein n=1 Tax=Anguilla anguilla TaxID=7936 RepID=A0A0E9W600_ANGAN